MSVRLLATRLAQHGRSALRHFWRREIHSNILEQQQLQKRRIPASVVKSAGANAKHAALPNSSAAQSLGKSPPVGIFRFGQHARKLFVDSILNRVTTTYSEELRTRATRKLFYGDSAPFFALVGVSLASGAGVLSKEDELEGVCWEIREAAARLQQSWNYEEVCKTVEPDFNIEKLDIGPAIAKGCAAVVYAAAFKADKAQTSESAAETETASTAAAGGVSHLQPNVLQAHKPLLSTEIMSPIQQMSRFVHNFGGSVDNLQRYSQNMAEVAFAATEMQAAAAEQAEQSVKEQTSKQNAGISSGMKDMQYLDCTNATIQRYPLALKMMFNYDIQSNAMSILRAMYRETVPARQRYLTPQTSSSEWQQLLQQQTVNLPAHPNIVCMFGYFCDQVGDFPAGKQLYPVAQPPRLNPLGYGRNMSLYLLMKRYDCSLRKFLDTHELNKRTKLLLFAQLLEAVAHINRHGIAHRDLKSDNLLIELNDDDTPPVLVLSDFGCCLADSTHGLQLPYTSADIDKGGNAALMAPEIINKQPGAFALLNYAKSDLWACGAIAYEIFGLPNPFYKLAEAGDAAPAPLRNANFKLSDLPALEHSDCPPLVQQLILNILNPLPAKRVSPDIAANIMQLCLWAPSRWLKAGGMPNSPEILQWLLSLSTKVMSEGRASTMPTLLSFQHTGRRTYVEYLLICSFLTRARLRRIRGALNWIQNVVSA